VKPWFQLQTCYCQHHRKSELISVSPSAMNQNAKENERLAACDISKLSKEVLCYG
jgi:DNA-binding transcriptional regulator YdaS (Cro superfamily)